MKQLILAFGMLSAGYAVAIDRNYLADLHESQWLIREHRLICELTHIIPRFGIARFQKSAGEDIRFTLSTFSASNRKQDITIDSINPEWRFSYGQRNMGKTSDNGTHVPFILYREPTLRLLYELEDGMRPTFAYKDAADATENMRIGLSSVNFRPAHQQFNHCIAKLLPFGFEDVNFTRVNFDINSDKLNDEMVAKLDKIIKYVKIDRTVRRVVVGGHTDWTGTSLFNSDLSKFRTYRVLDYLTTNGVPESIIQHANFGEEKPLQSNTTVRGRTINRRVTVEILRDP
jgi:outer membrane protein OmpA-like peptidoglycan-associated protein